MLFKIIIFVLIIDLITIKSSEGSIYKFPKVKSNRSKVYPITLNNEQLINAISYGTIITERQRGVELTIRHSNIKLKKYTPSHGQFLEALPNEQASEYNKIGQNILQSSLYLFNSDCRRVGQPIEVCAEIVNNYLLPDTDIKLHCQLLQSSKNLNGLHTFRRLLPADYVDGIYEMKYENLPLPKNISDELFNAQPFVNSNSNCEDLNTIEGIVDESFNIGLVQWAQFIEHDLVKVVVPNSRNGDPIECCNADFTIPIPRYRHPYCAPLHIADGVPRYNRIGCLNYIRSSLGIHADCKFGAAEQLNQATNLLDLSQLYGISINETNKLRTFINGELKSSNDPEYPTLFETNDYHLCMHNVTDDEIDPVCYQSGDSRVNTNPYITILYTLFLRNHNKIAAEKKLTSSSWTDNQLFDYARKINTIIYQKIIYEEWLKIILGETDANDINSQELPNIPIDKAVSNEFGTAGIRFYYSMIPGDLKMNVNGRERSILLKLEDEYYKPANLSHNNQLENILNAMLDQNAMAMDTGYVDDVSKYLFQMETSKNKSVGNDVLALDIIRGRDHGLPSYIKYLEKCTDDTINNWNDLSKYILTKDLNRLRSIYRSIDGIDLIVGAISEKPKRGALVGPTFACIIGEQLLNSKHSDDHFYTKRSEKQFYGNISGYTGYKLLCETTKLDRVPMNIFKKSSKSNPMIECDNVRSRFNRNAIGLK